MGTDFPATENLRFEYDIRRFCPVIYRRYEKSLQRKHLVNKKSTLFARNWFPALEAQDVRHLLKDVMAWQNEMMGHRSESGKSIFSGFPKNAS